MAKKIDKEKLIKTANNLDRNSLLILVAIQDLEDLGKPTDEDSIYYYVNQNLINIPSIFLHQRLMEALKDQLKDI